ncbi:MAG: histidine kinase [bacterium]|nr:histidine kinase [bacterium]
MKKILENMKMASVKAQMMGIFMFIVIVLGGTVTIALRFNYRATATNAEYIEYISDLSKLGELFKNSKIEVDEIKNKSVKEKSTVLENRFKEISESIENLKVDTSSVEITLRLRVVQYLQIRFESNVQQLLWLIEHDSEKNGTVSDTATYDEIYVKVADIAERADTYIKEMISISVEENKEFLLENKEKNKKMQQFLIGVMVGATILVIILCSRFALYFSKLIYQIMEITNRIAKGKKEKRIEAFDGPEEFQTIITSFNQLIETMDDLRLKAEEKAQLELKVAEDEIEKIRMRELLKEAKLQGLQFQIQPHFLFNTLNVISMLAIVEDNMKVYDLIMALSKFMRHSLKKTSELVRLEEELDMVVQYLYILKARKGEKLEYTVINKVEEEVHVPIFVLQPIVENAFCHGLEKKIEQGRIIIRTKMKGNILVLSVYNNGIPISREMLEKLRSEVSLKGSAMEKEAQIGITNVSNRLNIIFDGRVRYLIHSNERRGTLFTIQIDMGVH